MSTYNLRCHYPDCAGRADPPFTLCDRHQRAATASVIVRIKAAQVAAGTREAPTPAQVERDRRALRVPSGYDA